jgi:hypothetical protein
MQYHCNTHLRPEPFPHSNLEPRPVETGKNHIVLRKHIYFLNALFSLIRRCIGLLRMPQSVCAIMHPTEPIISMTTSEVAKTNIGNIKCFILINIMYFYILLFFAMFFAMTERFTIFAHAMLPFGTFLGTLVTYRFFAAYTSRINITAYRADGSKINRKQFST